MKLTLPCKRFLSVANVVAKSIAPKDTISQTLIKIDENSNKLIIQHRGSTSFFKGKISLMLLFNTSVSKSPVAHI